MSQGIREFESHTFRQLSSSRTHCRAHLRHGQAGLVLEHLTRRLPEHRQAPAMRPTKQPSSPVTGSQAAYQGMPVGRFPLTMAWESKP